MAFPSLMIPESGILHSFGKVLAPFVPITVANTSIVVPSVPTPIICGLRTEQIQRRILTPIHIFRAEVPLVARAALGPAGKVWGREGLSAVPGLSLHRELGFLAARGGAGPRVPQNWGCHKGMLQPQLGGSWGQSEPGRTIPTGLGRVPALAEHP